MSKSHFLSYWINFFVIGFLILGLLSIFNLANENIFMVFVAGMAVWGLSMPIFSSYCQNKYLKIYQEKYKNSDFINKNMSLTPHPGTSLLADLEMVGVNIDYIDSMVLMTCSLEHGCEYYDKKLKEELKSVSIDMYGSGKCKKTNDNITLHPVSTKLVEHENIIVTKDNRIFVYYEPSHLIKKGKDILKEGAYLFEVVKNKQTFKQTIIDKLKTLEIAA